MFWYHKNTAILSISFKPIVSDIFIKPTLKDCAVVSLVGLNGQNNIKGPHMSLQLVFPSHDFTSVDFSPPPPTSIASVLLVRPRNYLRAFYMSTVFPPSNVSNLKQSVFVSNHFGQEGRCTWISSENSCLIMLKLIYLCTHEIQLKNTTLHNFWCLVNWIYPNY